MSDKIKKIQIGETSYDIEPAVTSTLQVDNTAPTLAWNTTSVVGTVDGVDLTVKMPAQPAHQTIKQDGITGATINRFGTCTTAAGTAAKTVSITTGTFSLEAGARISVKFSNANTANTPTLNVATKGAKNIFHKGAQITSGANKALLAGVCDFIYDGTQWHLIGNYIDTDTNTATAVDDILDGSNSGTAITYKPYTSQQSKLSFDTSSTNPAGTDRLNLNGHFYATRLFSGGSYVVRVADFKYDPATKILTISED